MKLVHYSGVGLKIIAECIEMNANGYSTSLEVDLASDRVDLRRMKINDASDISRQEFLQPAKPNKKLGSRGLAG